MNMFDWLKVNDPGTKLYPVYDSESGWDDDDANSRVSF